MVGRERNDGEGKRERDETEHKKLDANGSVTVLGVGALSRDRKIRVAFRVRALRSI